MAANPPRARARALSLSLSLSLSYAYPSRSSIVVAVLCTRDVIIRATRSTWGWRVCVLPL